MNQNKLLAKRRKRQAKRKDAQVRARRRTIAEAVARSRPAKIRAPLTEAEAQKLLGGVEVAPVQFDAEPAPVTGFLGRLLGGA